MTTYRWSKEEQSLLPIDEWHEKYARKTDKAAHVWLDTPEVINPVTWKPLEGRAARREFMKRHNLVEVGNERRPAKSGKQLDF